MYSIYSVLRCPSKYINTLNCAHALLRLLNCLHFREKRATLFGQILSGGANIWLYVGGWEGVGVVDLKTSTTHPTRHNDYF